MGETTTSTGDRRISEPSTVSKVAKADRGY